MSQDLQLTSLRKKLLSLCPQLEKQIKQMSKTDLKELILMSQAQEQKVSNYKSPQDPEGGDEKKRNMMIQQLCELVPDIINKQELKLLSYEDIQDIYKNYKESPQLTKKKEDTKKSENRKRKIIENGEVNVYQMKRILIDKLPQYRNDIRNLPDDEIRRMYKDLQEKNQAQKQIKGPNGNEYSSGMNGNISSKPQMRSSNRYDEDQNYYQPQSESGQGADSFRKRGRPRKVKDFSGFSYDDPPSYGGSIQSSKLTSKSYDYKPGYSDPDYNSNFNKFQSEVQRTFNSSSAYDDGQMSYRSKASIQPYEAGPLALDYQGQQAEAPLPKSISKQNKNQHKCKITFYLSYSDLQSDESSSEKESQKNQRSGEQKQKKKQISRKNRLAKIIQSMQQAFAKKPWKIE